MPTIGSPDLVEARAEHYLGHIPVPAPANHPPHPIAVSEIVLPYLGTAYVMERRISHRMGEKAVIAFQKPSDPGDNATTILIGANEGITHDGRVGIEMLRAAISGAMKLAEVGSATLSPDTPIDPVVAGEIGFARNPDTDAFIIQPPVHVNTPVL